MKLSLLGSIAAIQCMAAAANTSSKSAKTSSKSAKNGKGTLAPVHSPTPPAPTPPAPTPTTGSPTTGSSTLKMMGFGTCADIGGQDYAKLQASLPAGSDYQQCDAWCTQVRHPMMEGFVMEKLATETTCACQFSGGLPNPTPNFQNPPIQFAVDGTGSGPITQTKPFVGSPICYAYVPGDATYAPSGTSSPTSPSPTKKPTTNPTKKPTHSPSLSPSSSPTNSPSYKPSQSPSMSPSKSPSKSPSSKPSLSPSSSPTTSPSNSPTMSPSRNPSKSPSLKPSLSPSSSPTTRPSNSPTNPNPTTSPSVAPPPTTKSPVSYPKTCNMFDVECGDGRACTAGTCHGGGVHATLTWQGDDDWMLHCYTPAFFDIHDVQPNTSTVGRYDATTGGTLDMWSSGNQNGRLDGTRIENCYWPDTSKMTTGTYSFAAEYYGGGSGGNSQATLKIYDMDGNLLESKSGIGCPISSSNFRLNVLCPTC